MKPFFSVHKRRPKAERKQIKPLFWLEPHRDQHHTYVVVYVPRRYVIVGIEHAKAVSS